MTKDIVRAMHSGLGYGSHVTRYLARKLQCLVLTGSDVQFDLSKSCSDIK